MPRTLAEIAAAAEAKLRQQAAEDDEPTAGKRREANGPGVGMAFRSVNYVPNLMNDLVSKVNSGDMEGAEKQFQREMEISSPVDRAITCTDMQALPGFDQLPDSIKDQVKQNIQQVADDHQRMLDLAPGASNGDITGADGATEQPAEGHAADQEQQEQAQTAAPTPTPGSGSGSGSE